MKYLCEITAIDPEGNEVAARGTDRNEGEQWDPTTLGRVIGDVLDRTGSPNVWETVCHLIGYLVTIDHEAVVESGKSSGVLANLVDAAERLIAEMSRKQEI